MKSKRPAKVEQIPLENGYFYYEYSCPVCGRKIFYDYDLCPDCGAEIDWEEGEDDG